VTQIEQGREADMNAHHIPTAMEIMVTSVITFTPEMSIFSAISTLISKKISGAPVLDRAGKVVGILSESDCLRVLSSDEFYAGQQEEEGLVKDFMTNPGLTIPPEMGIYAIAHYFITKPVRRLPVVREGRLLGQVSRRDVLKAVEEMGKKRQPNRKQYPDYRLPSSEVGARR
jgi:CBS domain-containing protein